MQAVISCSTLQLTIQTAGVTSAAVQPPGSGSELLQSTPSRGSLPRRESDNAVVGSGASPISSQSTSGQETLHGQHVHSDDEHGHGHESDQHEDDDDGHDHDHEHEHEHEYEMQDEYEEEDRLIAQGGLGIPLDEVSWSSPHCSSREQVDGPADNRSTEIPRHCYPL